MWLVRLVMRVPRPFARAMKRFSEGPSSTMMALTFSSSASAPLLFSALEAAENTAKLVATDMLTDPFLNGVLQHWTMIPIYAKVRFGHWDETLDAPKPEHPYPIGVWHYARGLAYERLGKPKEADAELTALRKVAKDPALEKVMILGSNSTVTLLQIAERILTGELASSRGKHDEAIAALREAADIEDTLRYAEPPDWFFPVRQNLGAALLAAGKPADAEAVYREDLFTYPENGWSLLGLSQSLRAQGKTAEALKVEERFQKAWKHADFELKTSRM